MRYLFLIIISFSLSFKSFSQNQHVIDSLIKVIADVEAECGGKPCFADTGRINAYLSWGEVIFLNKPDTAVVLYENAQDLAENLLATNPPTHIADTTKKYLAYTLLNIGNINYIHGDIPKTIEYYNKSLILQEEIGDKKGMALSYNNIGGIYYNQGDIPKALEYFNKSLIIQEETGDKKGMADSFNNIGMIYSNQGDIPKALEYLNKSLIIRKEMGDKYGMSYSFNNIGYIYDNQGDISIALEYYNKSLILKEEIGDKQGMAISFNNIGNIYSNQGKIPKALEYLNKGLSIREEIGDKQGMGYSFSSIGTIYRNQGDIPKALEYFNKSLSIREEIGDKQGIATCFINIGNIYDNQGDIPKALEYYNKSLSTREEIGDKKGMAYSYNNIGLIYKNQGDIPKALEYYDKSLSIREEIGDKQGIAYSLFNLGRVSQDQKNVLLFKEYATRCYKINKELGSPYGIQNAASLMKDLMLLEENYAMADSLAIEVIDINNKSITSNFATLPESGQEKYFKTVVRSYMDFNSYSEFRKDNNPDIVDIVYNNTIKNKGLLLRSSTAMRNEVLNSGDTLLIDYYYKWINLKKQIANLDSKGQNTDSLNNIANEYEKELVRSSKIFSDYKNLQQIKWQDVQKGLKQNEAAIEFIHFKYKNYNAEKYWEFTDTTLYCALLVKPESKHPQMIALFNDRDLENILGKYGENNLSYINGIYGKNNEINTRLYDLIWKPMEEYLKDVKTIYLSPSGLLHKVSFSAIAKDQNVYLSDNFNINILSNIGKLVMSESSVFDDKMTLSLFGGINYNSDSTETEIWKYLEGTKKEVKEIESILRKKKYNVNFALDQFATEEMFKQQAPNSNIIHIASHGFFYPDPKEEKEKIEQEQKVEYADVVFRGGSRGFGIWSFVKNPNPLMRSGLVLAGANDVWSRVEADTIEDGVLTAQEVAHIDMRKTDLVVMSACETGLGDIKGSEGVYGLQRAFKMAGVKNIIMSLWQVPDKETEEFMTTFYTKLLKEKDIKQAFNQTQKEMRQKYDPYFWAAFVLIE